MNATRLQTVLRIAKRAAELNMDMDPFNCMGMQDYFCSYVNSLIDGDAEGIAEDTEYIASEEPKHAQECASLIQMAKALVA